ncbi:MBL fold metallo-hydrolase [Pantoea sp. UYEF8]|uniref:MBL fold metallo-hydrolase n=1 Tax=Pantoea sp. UYEF8 TaxID=1756394 RepID=UPI003397B439
MNYPAFPKRQIGDYLVTALSDGVMSASLDLLSGIDIAEAADIQHNASITQPGNIHINGYLIQGRGQTLLVDAGAGSLNNVGGQLACHLAATGVSPDEVNSVLLTHGHPDHIGGLLDAAEQPMFKHAELHLHFLEAEYWQDEENFKRANERGQRNFKLARRALSAYAGKIRLINQDEIAEGIAPVWLPGHTPGHTGFRITSAEKSLLIWGDIVHFPPIQAARPEVSVVFDCDPRQAEETRKKILSQAAREKLLIAGMHLDRQGFARVSEAGQGYRIVYQQNE